MSYRPTRFENEECIRMLAGRYPKCFFEIPQMRRPLKIWIVQDLQRDGFPAAPELIEAAVAWYKGHFGYLYALKTGAKRVDLNGREVGTVTELEQRVARKMIDEGNQLRHELERKSNPVAVLTKLHRNGVVPDDQLKKLDAPSMSTPSRAKAPINVVPELARIHEAFVAATTALSSIDDASLRSAMASAALSVVIKETQRVISEGGETR